MTDDDLRLKFTGPFILERVYPTAAELVVGYEHGWLGPRDAVEVTLAKLKAGSSLAPEEESIALLLSDDLDQVDDLIAALRQRVEPAGFEPVRVWLYLALGWLWARRTSIEDPHRMLEEVYTQFGYPSEIAHLVEYMPVQPGGRVGPTAIDDNWEEYLRARSVEYARTR
ncbi:MAG: DUF2247 family protein [Acidimicrobiales bacterium]